MHVANASQSDLPLLVDVINPHYSGFWINQNNLLDTRFFRRQGDELAGANPLLDILSKHFRPGRIRRDRNDKTCCC